MPLAQFVNGNVTTTSVNNQLSTDVTVTPTATTGFPNQPYFTVLVRQSGEILLVTAVNAGPTWTVTRGFGGTAAAGITAGNNFDYSITREMLLAGFMAKLDEQSISVDTAAAVMTLTVPSGLAFLRNLEVRFQGGATTNAYLLFRFNSDSSSSYFTNYSYGGSGSANGNSGTVSFGRCWAGNPGAALPNIGSDVHIKIGNADMTDRWKSFVINQWLRQSAGDQYTMMLTGVWQPAVQAAISTIQISVDNANNGVWAAGTMRAGSRATLYGLP